MKLDRCELSERVLFHPTAMSFSIIASVASEYSVTLTIRDLESRLPIFHPGVKKD